MYNPFPLLTPGLLREQVGRGKRYFVRQNFPRGYEGRLKAAFLLRGYEGEEKEMAERHLAAVSLDPNAFLYDAGLPEHLDRLMVAARQPFGYKIFYAAKKGVDWKPPDVYQAKMRAYIWRHHPDWRSQKEGDKILIGLYEEFGELYLKFSHEDEHDRILFDLIEKY